MVKPFLSENACFSTFFKKKENRQDKMMQSNYFSVVLLVKRKKLLIVTVFTRNNLAPFRKIKFRFKQNMLYMGYIGMCRCEGHGFQAVYSRIGYINQSIWV